MCGGQQCMVHLISLPQLLKLAGKLCHMVPNYGLNYTSDSVNLILYLFLVSSMLMYVQNSCYMAETNPVFTNKFSINNVVQKNHPVTRSVQSIRLCSTVLLEQWSSEGLTNIGVPSSFSQSSCPMGRLQAGHALLPIFDSSSRRFLLDFIHLFPYPEMEVAHTAVWHVVLAGWKSRITMRWYLIPASPSSDLAVSVYHACTMLYHFTGSKKITVSIRWNQFHIYLLF